MHFYCSVLILVGMCVSPNTVFLLILLISISLLCFAAGLFFFFKKSAGQRRCMRGVYMEIFLSLLYSVVFLPVLDLTFFFYYYYFQLHCSSQPQIHSSPFLFKFYFKHLTEKVLIIFYFKV